MSYTRSPDRSQINSRVIPRFFMDTSLDQVASQREGRPIFRDRELVELIVPGENNQRHVARVTDEHRHHYAEHYKAFKDKTEMPTDGIPLEMWPSLPSRAAVEELKGIQLRTVEDVAEMSDAVCQRIRVGGFRLRELAKAYLDDAYAAAALEKATAAQQALEARLAASDAKVAELAALVDRLHQQLQGERDRQPELATMVPAMHDPIEAAKYANPYSGEAPATSALDNLPVVKRRGRPPNSERVHDGAASG